MDPEPITQTPTFETASGQLTTGRLCPGFLHTHVRILKEGSRRTASEELPSHPPARTFKARQLPRVTRRGDLTVGSHGQPAFPVNPPEEQCKQAGWLRQAGQWQEESEQFSWPVTWVDWVTGIENQVWPKSGQPYFFRKSHSFEELLKDTQSEWGVVRGHGELG